MKKLRLDVDRLKVESFLTGDANEPRGTVQANALFATRPGVCDPFSLPPRCS
jgi:hypothetical protein